MGIKSIQTGVTTLAVMALLSACSNVATPVVEPSSGTRDDRASFRQCSIELNDSTASSIGGFFGEVVTNIEGPATVCLQVAGLNRDVSATLRVEYEDDSGIRFFETKPENLFFGEIKQQENLIELELIFIDDYGLVSVKGQAVGAENMDAEIRYYNFLSFEQELEYATEVQAAKCRSGELTVAQCLGYNFPPTYWWNQPLPLSPQSRLLEEARSNLSSTTRSRRLGNINVSVSQILAN
jgi:hypothetical protein